MSPRGPDPPTRPERPVSRRRFLAATGGATVAALAGCSGLTQQSFEATAVVLPEGTRAELFLEESFRDAATTTGEWTIGGEDVEVTITDRFAGYRRTYSPPGTAWSGVRPTLVERFAGAGREDTPGSGSAINAVATDLGIDQSNPSYVAGDTRVGGDRVTLVVPERARQDGEVGLADLMAVHHAAALGVDELTSRGGNNYLMDLERVLPDGRFLPGPSGYEPDERWVAGHEGHWLPDDTSSLRCLVCLGERSPESLFGVEEMPGGRLEDGETVDTEDTLLFVPAPKESPAPDPGVMEPAEVFDAGYPTPVGGQSYGLAVIATPNAEIAGESVNPLAHLGLGELLTSGRARDVLVDAGLTDADEVEWLRGPERFASDAGGGDLRSAGLCPGSACARPPSQVTWLSSEDVTVLGEEVGVEVYGGVVSGVEGPWAVAVHAAKAAVDDVVIVAAVHRRPAGTPDGRELFGDGDGFLDRRWTTRALEFTGEVFPGLEAAPEGA